MVSVLKFWSLRLWITNVIAEYVCLWYHKQLMCDDAACLHCAQRTLDIITCCGSILADVVFTAGCAMKGLASCLRTLGLLLPSTSHLLRYDCVVNPSHCCGIIVPDV